jgi:anti-sigma B factor antagonist
VNINAGKAMNVQVDRQENQTVVVVEEPQIDIQNAADLREILLNQIYSGNMDLLLDLQHVEFIDSSGLGALVFGLREARKKKGNIKIAGLSEHVSSMFSITRLNKIFEIS